MKSFIITVAAVMFIATASYSQKIEESKVPTAVKAAFKNKFPQAVKASWEMEKKDYEVNFSLDNRQLSANFSPVGKWLETETAVELSKLPKAVSGALAEQFAGYTVKEADLVEAPGKAAVYEVDVVKGKESLELQFSEKGELLKKEVAGKEED